MGEGICVKRSWYLRACGYGFSYQDLALREVMGHGRCRAYLPDHLELILAFCNFEGSDSLL